VKRVFKRNRFHSWIVNGSHIVREFFFGVLLPTQNDAQSKARRAIFGRRSSTGKHCFSAPSINDNWIECEKEIHLLGVCVPLHVITFKHCTTITVNCDWENQSTVMVSSGRIKRGGKSIPAMDVSVSMSTTPIAADAIKRFNIR
jgi:hypothetical protein